MIRVEPVADLQKASAVARSYVLEDIALTEVSAKRSAPYERDSVARLTLSTATDAVANLRGEGETLSVQVKFEVLAIAPDTPDGQPRVQVTGVFALEYVRSDKDARYEPGHFEVFARLNGVYNAWPYIREVVSNAFSRLGYPRLTLEPLIINARPAEAKAIKKQAQS